MAQNMKISLGTWLHRTTSILQESEYTIQGT